MNVIIYNKRDFADVVEVKNPKMEILYWVIPMDPKCNHNGIVRTQCNIVHKEEKAM